MRAEEDIPIIRRGGRANDMLMRVCTCKMIRHVEGNILGKMCRSHYTESMRTAKKVKVRYTL